jgi:invasion protein IalB
MRTIFSALVLSLALGVGTVFAQTTTAPAPTPAPTAQPAAPAAASPADKKAISKSCTDQANAKGLHGKARKKFRSECKRAGGKPQ